MLNSNTLSKLWFLPFAQNVCRILTCVPKTNVKKVSVGDYFSSDRYFLDMCNNNWRRHICRRAKGVSNAIRQ